MTAPDFPRPFGVPPLPSMRNEYCEARSSSHGRCYREPGHAGEHANVVGSWESRGALAGPESAAEQLRNALMLVDHAHESAVEIVRDLAAGRRRVAAALALLEGK